MTWQEVLAAIARSHHAIDGGAGWCGLQLDVGARRPQRLAVKLGYDETAVVLMAQVCAQHHIEPGLALGYNSVIEHVSLGLESGVYVLRCTRPLAPLSDGDLAILLAALTYEATRLRRAHVVELDDDVFASLGIATFGHWTAPA